MVELKIWRHRIRRGLALLMAAVAGVGAAVAAESVITYHGAADRSGLYVAPTLTWTNAPTVRLDTGFHAAVDGAVYSQPLYWVPPAGGAGLIIVATENNSVYALDAGSGAQVWKTTLGPPVPRSALPCGNIDPMGVTGTPTMDPAAGVVYVEAYVAKPVAGPRHMVFGLSLATGALAPGWPVDVGNGLAALGRGFNERASGQRSALTLVNGKLYVPYAGHWGDCGVYHGMVVGLDVAKPAVFGAWKTGSPAGGSWGQSGVAFDGAFLFMTTGNAIGGSPTSWAGSEAVIRLPPTTLANPASDADFFAPRNWQALDNADLDLGGTSAIPVNTPVLPRVLALGKDGNAYLLNRDNLGGVGHEIAVTQVSTSEIITAMATYPVADGAMVAFEGQGAACPTGQSGNLVMLKITPLAIATAWCAAFNGSGAPIVTTTDGKSNPIVWIAGAQGDGKLYGFRGTDGARLAAVAGGAAPIQRYQTLLWANGRFYVAANGAVYAFTY
ncbi:MAG: PQQ-binding-like beta-propeller repeat protein [Hyphomicrobiales bacterium]|nr:PQQ-binding-like beta-propeller repeat protein [Hyphomicrobiales bacterium]